MGCVFLVNRLGFNYEVDSDEINFIVWTGIGKKINCAGIKLFSSLGLLCSLVNAPEQEYQSGLEVQRQPQKVKNTRPA